MTEKTLKPKKGRAMYTREQVLDVVDACFHMFSSYHRAEAKEEAARIMSVYNEETDKEAT